MWCLKLCFLLTNPEKISFGNLQKMYIQLKFIFSKKAKKNDEIFTVDLTLCSKRQIDSEDFVNFHGLFRKYELYLHVKSLLLGGNFQLKFMFSKKATKI